jgi:predicted DNA-binding protein YlxM (UPF0122 family)
MKAAEKKEARRLRKEGFSIGEIANKVEVSKSSVSLWVRDIELTKAQKERLQEKSHLFVSKKNTEFFRKKRKFYQDAGKEKAKQGDQLHLIGCMLHWAEGSKERQRVDFTNSDPEMMLVFMKFLRECYEVKDEDISVSIQCYNDIHTVEEIESYWLNLLHLPNGCLRKTLVNKYPKISKRKRKSCLEFGTCKIRVSKVELQQNIYGAIQEYIGFKKDKWLD